ncbi:uncharacterized protein DNG_08164 [Cephalotrichum gorgonifer]|uniref:F-box domain-containing protein n=1 Tax=Cephalotrichum gorgonifer TaxID=2041049 RepID=A0AAE8SYW8_9PEZI|nr:uncharacterized protein DNG_08164 [Cephalotrichum gorgonifer]
MAPLPGELTDDRPEAHVGIMQAGDETHDGIQPVAAGPRKRTHRACDKCSSSRTRCDALVAAAKSMDIRVVMRPDRVSVDASQSPLPAPGSRDDVALSGRRLLPMDDEEADSDRIPRLPQPDPRPSLAASSNFDLTSPHNAMLGDTLEFPSPHSERLPLNITAESPRTTSTGTQNGRPHHAAVPVPILERNGTVPQDSRNGCYYQFLAPVIPHVRHILSVSEACDLLNIYLTEPRSALFSGASPYILTRIFRKKSILHPPRPRPTSPALLATILWCVAQTADMVSLHLPGSRAKLVNGLYDVATSLISERDVDRWRRVQGDIRLEKEVLQFGTSSYPAPPGVTAANEPAGTIDDVLTYILLTIAISGGDFKSDYSKWWSKATRLAFILRLNREDECSSTSPATACSSPLCTCRKEQAAVSYEDVERQEERRRVFWLLYSLDRHLALSFNSVVVIPDSYLQVYSPLPEVVWENLESFPLEELLTRTMGPPTKALGTGFLGYFLPLMTILGDIMEIHHRRRHPRLGGHDDAISVAAAEKLLEEYGESLEMLSCENTTAVAAGGRTHGIPFLQREDVPSPGDQEDIALVKAYGTHILHVLHVLLHGKWDAISMLDNADDWITSWSFNECASHAIAASESVSTVLSIDPELTFMPYLFGIYLLHGSFIFLLFADRMPQVGQNKSVEQACEAIIRAHEVCVVTLSTEFQKNFRKVLRSILYSVRGIGVTSAYEQTARLRSKLHGSGAFITEVGFVLEGEVWSAFDGSEEFLSYSLSHTGTGTDYWIFPLHEECWSILLAYFPSSMGNAAALDAIANHLFDLFYFADIPRTRMKYEPREEVPGTKLDRILPREVLYSILAMLESSDVKNFRLVSRDIAAITDVHSLPQTFWASRFAIDGEMGFYLTEHAPLGQKARNLDWRKLFINVSLSVSTNESPLLDSSTQTSLRSDPNAALSRSSVPCGLHRFPILG